MFSRKKNKTMELQASFKFIALFLLIGVIQIQAQTYAGYQVKGRFLYDGCGEKVVLRGVNFMFCWFGDPTGAAVYPEIAKSSSNCVRIVWQMSSSVSQLDESIANCVKNKMIPMPEIHDVTGNWSGLPDVVNWWLRSDVVAVIKKYEKYLLLNIANECGDYNVSNDQFRAVYGDALKRFRAAGIRVPVVIDANGWGQNDAIIFNNWANIKSQDPDTSVIFSLHVYSGDNARMQTIASRVVSSGIPFLFGEFATKGDCNGSEIGWQELLKQSQQNQLGWLAWSWGTNVAANSCMDMTASSGAYSTLTAFGNQIVNGANGIKSTSIVPQSLREGTCGGETPSYVPPIARIPGRIEAENYDTTGDGTGYHDVTTGNSGGALREDDVDIESCADAGKSGYSVSYISKDEWLAYTAAIAQAGNYTVTARFATEQTTPKAFHLQVDKKDVGTVFTHTGSTGGWSSWIDVAANHVPLPAGNHEVRIVMDSAEFNLNYLDFALETSKVKSLSPIQNMGMDIALIKYAGNQVDFSVSLPNSEAGQFTLYDLLGKKLWQHSFTQTGSERIHRVVWQVPSAIKAEGIVFAKLETSSQQEMIKRFVLVR